MDFVLKNPDIQPDLGELEKQLDLLSISVHLNDFKFDENEYPDPPEKDHAATRLVLEKKFPNIGFYYTVDSNIEESDSPEVTVGDAIDDLVDIVGELEEVRWYFENTSKENALWHFQNSYRSHWGRHLKELQLVIHQQGW